MKNLQAEMVRRGVTIEQLAAAAGVSLSTIYNKLSKKTPLHYSEAVAIRDQLFPDLAVEYLFEGGETT